MSDGTKLNEAVDRHHNKCVNDSFYQGFAAALGSLAREHGRPSMARDIMNCNGVTFKQLRDAGVEQFDLLALGME
jgi:hypothetical protein